MTDTKSNKSNKSNKMNKSLDRHYMSELDLFLQEFDKKPEAYSESRYAEEEKYRKIIQFRDNANPDKEVQDRFHDDVVK